VAEKTSKPGKTGPSEKAPRFYKIVGVEIIEGGYAIALDGKRVRTPMGATLAVPGRGLAAAIAEEWAAAIAQEWQFQTGRPKPKNMPLTQLAATAIDRAKPRRGEVARDLAAMAHSDALLLRAASPADLAARQSALWQPWLEWLKGHYGVSLTSTAGLVAVEQSANDLQRLAAVVAARDEFQLAGLADVAGVAGSIVLALAVAEGALEPETATALSQLEERYQAERWGVDPEAEARRQAQGVEITRAAHFLALHRA
jgi:chaperone required for assembly of F1-ATPase